MKDVYGLNPINKTAALVTSQSGCASDDTLSNEQERENLVSQVKILQADILTHKKGSAARRAIGAILLTTNQQINELRPAKKNPGIERYILDILREDLSKFEFDRLQGRAAERMKAAAKLN